jgi:DNA-binding HxlR family transcriptional regulator
LVGNVLHGAVSAIDASIADLLRLLGGGAGGAIIMVLGGGPLRTMRLTERLPQYAPRTIYRYVGKLAELGLVDRREGPGVPSTVVYSLSRPLGRALYHLVDAYASAALLREGGRQIDDAGWTSLCLLGEAWESGWVDELSRGARSTTDLAEARRGLTFHQVSRRVHLLKSSGLLREHASRGRGKRYQLDEQARRGMALLLGLGRWRQRHPTMEGRSGLTVQEMVTALRTSLPLVRLIDRSGASIKLGVAGATDENGGRGSATLLSKLGPDGSAHCISEASDQVDGWALGTTNTWLAALLDGNRGRMRVGGDLEIVDAFLVQLHEALWRKRESFRPATADR